MSLILIHETKSYWTAELSRQFLSQTSADQSPPVLRWRPYREELFQEAPSAALIVLVCEPTDDSLHLVTQLRTHAPHAELVTLVSSEEVSWEWVAREMGVAVVFSDCTVREWVARSIRNLLNSRTRTNLPHLSHP